MRAENLNGVFDARMILHLFNCCEFTRSPQSGALCADGSIRCRLAAPNLKNELSAGAPLFLQHGFEWSKLSPNDRDRIIQAIAECVENFDGEQQIVWTTFVAGFPRTRSSLQFLQRLLIETRGLSLTEAEIQRSLADAR